MEKYYNINQKPKWFFPLSFYTSSIIFIVLFILDQWLDPDPVDGGTFVFFALFAATGQIVSIAFYQLRIRLAPIPFALVVNGIGIALLLAALKAIML